MKATVVQEISFQIKSDTHTQIAKLKSCIMRTVLLQWYLLQGVTFEGWSCESTTAGELGGAWSDLVSTSESLNCHKRRALLHQSTLFLLIVFTFLCTLEGQPDAAEFAIMVLGAVRDPDPVPVAPSGLKNRRPCSPGTFSLDEVLDEVTGPGRVGSDMEVDILLP